MKLVKDMMVRNPVVAETWQLVAHVRHAMLLNSFSHLPVLVDGKVWYTVSDVTIMHFLRKATSRKDLEKRLSTSLYTAIKERKIDVTEAECINQDMLLIDAIGQMKVGPILVTERNDGGSQLIGIVTAFDLL